MGLPQFGYFNFKIMQFLVSDSKQTSPFPLQSLLCWVPHSTLTKLFLSIANTQN